MKKFIKITFASIASIIGVLVLTAIYIANKNYEDGKVLFIENGCSNVYTPTGYGKKRPDDFPPIGKFITSKSEYILLYMSGKFGWWNERNYIY